MWDAHCEAEARKLFTGNISRNGAGGDEQQQYLAHWLNQRLPYPGWRVEVYKEAYWVAKGKGEVVYLSDNLGVFVVIPSEHEYDTLMEAMTAIELGYGPDKQGEQP